MKKRIIVIMSVIWMLVLVGAASSTLTLALVGGSSTSSAATSDVRALAERYSRLDEVRKTLMDEYYTDVDEQTLILGAIRGMMSSLDDPYTFYYTTEEMRDMREESEGVYHGVGMMVSMTSEQTLRVVRVFRDSPAEKSGVLAGDILLAVDGVAVSGETSKHMNEAVSMIRGADNSPVTITVLRGDEQTDLTMTRGDVNINYVEYQILDGDIGYLVLYQFMGDCVKGFEEAISAFKAANVSGMIVDVRSNPGGLLKDVVKICDMLLPEGLIVYTEDNAGKRAGYYSDAEYWDIPLVILADENSASASEIFAASMQDYNRGIVVGDTTFGKGIVQTLITFREDGTGMQYTSSSYYTPNGNSIHGTGVTPDIAIEMSEDYDASILSADPNNDNQLQAAMDVLREMIGN